MEHYSVIIVGGGPIGLACALEAKKRGLDYLVLEKGTPVNSLYHYPLTMTFFSTSERLEIGDIPFVSDKPKPQRSEALEYYRRVTSVHELQVRLFEEVLQIVPLTTEWKLPKGENKGRKTADPAYQVVSSKAVYSASHVVLATGFYDLPYLLNVPGEDLPKVKHYYRDPNYYSFQKLVVVGASNSAVDAALETWRKGAQVTMVVRGSEIGQRVKYWVRPDIVNRIAEGSIKAYFNSTVNEIREDEVDIVTPEGLVTIKNDWVLALTGYQPNLPFLKKVGVQLCDDETCKPVYNEETHETNMKNIYLAGVICGGMNTHRLFIENSREHAVRIMNKIASEAGLVT